MNIGLKIDRFTLKTKSFGDMEVKLPASQLEELVKRSHIENPYVKANFEKMRSYVAEPCEFVSEIELGEELVGKKHIYLTLFGVYATAELFFNGKSYGVINSAEREYRIDISDNVKIGKNIFSVKCASALPNEDYVSTTRALSYSHPYIQDIGILGECELRAAECAMIERVCTEQIHKGDKVIVEVDVDVLGNTSDIRAVATLVSPLGKVYFGGISRGKGKITVSDADLWQPNGMGHAALYKLSVALYKHDVAIDIKEVKIGLRSVEIEEKDGAIEQIKVNDRVIVPKCVTYSPKEIISAHMYKKEVEEYIKAAKEASVNVICVKSTALCPDVDFYGLCDKHGLLVFETVSVPYTRGNMAVTLSSGLSERLVGICKRLACHPCVAAFAFDVTVPRGEAVSRDDLDDFSALLHKLTHSIFEKYAKSHILLKRGMAKALSNEICEISTPSAQTLESFLEEGEINIGSDMMRKYIPEGADASEIAGAVFKYFRYPFGMDEFVYASQLTAAQNMKLRVNNARLVGEGSPMFAGALNDGGYAVSDSLIDYDGNRKASYYYAKELFSPIYVLAKILGAGVEFSVYNHSRKKIEGELIYSLYSVCGKCIAESSVKFELDSFEKPYTEKVDFSAKIKNRDINELYVVCELLGKSGILFSSVFPMAKLASFKLPAPDITCEVSGEGRRFDVVLATKKCALGVRLTLEGEKCHFAENFIDMTDRSTKKIVCETKNSMTAEEFKSKLKILSMYDIGRKM